MYQFNVNDYTLDLPDDFGLSFEFTNSKFGFDNIKLSRTQEFSLVATPINNSAFDFASRSDGNGNYARKVLDARLLYSGGAIDGKLYVSSIENREYKCCFIFGELDRLKAIKESGKIKEYLNLTDSVFWGSSSSVNSSMTVYDFAIYQYSIDNLDMWNDPDFRSGWMYMPSVRLTYLAVKCAEFFGINLDLGSGGFNSYITKLVVKLNGLKNPETSISSGIITASAATSLIGGFNTSFFSQSTMPRVAALEPPYSTPGVGMNGKPCVECITATRMDVSLGTWAVEQKDSQTLGIIERGILITDANGSIKNRLTTPSSTVSVELSIGDRLTFFQATRVSATQSSGYYTYIDYSVPTSLPMPYDHYATSTTMSYNSTYYLQPNLPDITFIDILKIIANLTDTSISYNPSTNTISFEDYVFDDDLTYSLDDNLVSEDKIIRGFSNFAQKNIIHLKDDDYVPSSERYSRSYLVNNEVLESEKILYTAPLTEGREGLYYGIRSGLSLYAMNIADIVGEASSSGIKFSFGKYKDVLCSGAYSPANSLIGLVPYASSSELASMLSLSTSVEVTVRMPLFIFTSIKSNSYLFYKAQKWCVSSASWQNNFAKLTLQKIA